MRGIYLRGNVYWLAIQKDKKRHFVSLETSDPGEAISKAAEIRDHPVLESGSLITHTADRFLAYKADRDKRGLPDGWRPPTVESKGHVVKNFAAWCGVVTPARVTPAKIWEWFEYRVGLRCERTAFGNLMTISSFFNYCRDVEKVMRENPVTACLKKYNIKTPKPAPREDFCSGSLRDALIDHAPDDQMKFILFAGFHGFRKLEIIEAVPKWFVMSERRLDLRKHAGIKFKDNEERTLPMSKKFHAFLEEYGLRKPYMIASDTKKGEWRYRYDFRRPYSDYVASVGWCCETLTPMSAAVCPKCGNGLEDCSWVTPHIMRHTFASLLAQANVSIFKIAKWMGIAVRVAEKTYAKLRPDHAGFDEAMD